MQRVPLMNLRIKLNVLTRLQIVTNFVLFEIKSLDNQTIIGRFYQEQLVKAVEPESYIIEKVLKENKRTGKLLVKWEGYEEPSWISKADVTTVKDLD